ncbi:hypothetical protein EVAR_100183_1 [Eumeta japonica]|uniref:Uncharacterized protein n=1 Tax=Eumeta variegata TaxID=151549 RepID=A0A4C2A8D2_EUMVA|nr:hypothetical protein EVAR_100183_1 [Eumeta japonica]
MNETVRGEGCGVGPLIGRAVRDARVRKAARSAHSADMSAARHTCLKIYAEQKSGPSSYPDCEENCENCVVNKVKMASTRSKTRLRECNTAEESTIADRAGVVRRARISSTVRRRTVNPDAPAAPTDEWRSNDRSQC